LSDLVQSLGYIAVTFASADEFLRSDFVAKSACVITDVLMPGMSGVDLQAHMLANAHKTSFIFITSLPSESIRTQALRAGAFGFLKKPFDDDSLVECLNRALARSPS
jgi:FixJ family two-component response regulator